jgi:phosphatidylinositol glycan class V
VIPDWKHDPDEAFQTPRNVSAFSPVDKVVEHALGGLARWDAEYFVHIAAHGYDREQSIAFFPAWPYLLSMTSSWIVNVFGSLFSQRSAILVSGTVLNLCFSLGATDALFRLTSVVVGPEMAYYSAVLFCACPATVYFSALYTEPLFAWATFESLFWLYK